MKLLFFIPLVAQLHAADFTAMRAQVVALSTTALLVQLQWVNATNCPATNYEVIVWQSTDLKNWSVDYDGIGVTNCYLPMNQQEQFFKLSAQYAGRLTALTSAQIEYRAAPLAERMKLRAALAERTRETVAAIKLD